MICCSTKEKWQVQNITISELHKLILMMDGKHLALRDGQKNKLTRFTQDHFKSYKLHQKKAANAQFIVEYAVFTAFTGMM